MASSLESITEQRHDQIFPVLDSLEIERVRRFGETRSFSAGEALVTSGQVAPGLMVILAGTVAVTEHGYLANPKPILIHSAGNFMGELAQLAGRPALVDAVAQEPVEALIIPPERLRALLIAEAELGERIMRALILRRDRHHRSWNGRTDHPRSRRERRRLAASRLFPPQRVIRTNCSIPRPTRPPMPDRTLSRRSRPLADRAVSHRTIAAQSR